MDDAETQRGRPVATLTRENQELWFQNMKRWLYSKDCWKAIETPESKHEAAFTKIDNTALYWINKCISEDDQMRYVDTANSKTLWDQLQARYKKTLPVQRRLLVESFHSFQKDQNQTIQDAWLYLQQLGRKIASSDPTNANLGKPEARIQKLLASLPEEYDTTVNAIDVQSHLDPEDILTLLENFEAKLNSKTTSHAYLARNRQGPIECHLCKKDHFVKDCPSLPAAQRAARDDRRQKRSSQSSRQEPMIAMKDLEAVVARVFTQIMEDKAKVQTKVARKERAYRAEETSTVSSATSKSPTAVSFDDQVSYEVAHLSKDVTSKNPSQWYMDSCASSHMTDKSNCFRGPLIQIRRRYIQVGGGILHSDSMGTAILADQMGRELELKQTLFVPGLGANLLSARNLCLQKRLNGKFNSDSMTMVDASGNAVVHSKIQHGVYVVADVYPERLPKQLNTAMLATDNTTAHAFNAIVSPQEEELSSKAQEEYQLWHRRIAHLGPEKIRNLHKVTTLEKPVQVTPDHQCIVCSVANIRNKRGATSKRKEGILELIHIDTCGQMPESREGYIYFISVVDNFSRKTWIFPMRAKSDAAPILNQWKKEVETATDLKILAVRSDNAPELENLFGSWRQESGVQHESTVHYMSSQNGPVERSHQTIQNGTRAMLKDANLPVELWVEAAQADVYIRNRVSNGPIIDGVQVSPEEAFTGIKPSIDHLRVWGCQAVSYMNPDSLPQGTRRDKFMDRGRHCVFLGYVEGTIKQWLFWAPDMRKVIKSHRADFFENKQGGDLQLGIPRRAAPNTAPLRNLRGRPPLQQAPATDTTTVLPVATATSKKTVPQVEIPAFPEHKRHLYQDFTQGSGQLQPENGANSQEERDSELSEESDVESQEEPRPSSPVVAATTILAAATVGRKVLSHVEVPRVSKRMREEYGIPEGQPDFKLHKAMLAINLPSLGIDLGDNDQLDILHHAFMAAFSAKEEVPIPKSYQAAIDDPTWGPLWQEAFRLETDALWANGTFEITKPPTGANIITSRWVLAAKHNLDGSLQKLKARLVARGFTQKFGVDFDYTFAPTLRHDTLRVFFAIVAMEDLECHAVDVNNAFTESTLKEEIYMAAPPGMNIPPGCVLKVLRSLYGLKQAARDWNQSCIESLQKMGFIQTDADPCLLRHLEKEILILVYVDDILIGTKQMDNINWFKKHFGEIYKIKDLGEVSKILGVQVIRDRKNRTITLDQSHYTKDLLSRHGMDKEKANPISIPLNGYDLLKPAGPQDKRADQKEYQKIIGGLIYLAILTRPDIAFAIGRLSQYLSDPSEGHFKLLKSLMRYLRSTTDLGLEFNAEGMQQLVGYSDSDYAMDKLDRISILGSVFMMGNCPVSWSSKKQKSVATSTMEAEYMAMCQAAKQSQWLAQLLRDMGYGKYIGCNQYQPTVREEQSFVIRSPVKLFGDNQASLSLVRDAHTHERSKHIDVAYHYVRDLHRRNRINVEFIGTRDMVADGFTKPLPKPDFARFIDQLGLTSIRRPD
ncbi:MAG: Nucleotide-diphospho-sugar transferase [Aureobasidium pullulans]|nr:MAG: Nucleotide-diphospho-sugar transferase [Aureobasidium pullulans]